MSMLRVFAPLIATALFAAGCGSGGSGPAGSSTGWSVAAEGSVSPPAGAKSYGSADFKKGDRVRATVTSDKEPIGLRLYLNVNGKETDLGKKEKVKEATLEATVPADGAVMLQMSNDTKGDTSVRYKMEKHAGE